MSISIVQVCGTTNNPNYNSRTVDYDFSILVTLCEEVDFTTDISPACLPTSSNTNYDNRQAVVSGWGTLSSGGSTPTVLHEVTLNTMSNAQVIQKDPLLSTALHVLVHWLLHFLLHQ